MHRRVSTAALFIIGCTVPFAAAAKAKQHAAADSIIWQAPRDAVDLAYGPTGIGGAPRPPFRLEHEDLSGTTAKLTVKDAAGRTWSVKFGPEAHASPFSAHFAAACGYIVETEYYVARGRITHVHNLQRAAEFIGPGGAFEEARFQLRSKSPKFLKGNNWAWSSNPFLGTHEFNGLRILMMLLSNWDAKDARNFPDVGQRSKYADSNLAIFEIHGRPHRYEYFVSDWGETLGKWGSIPLLRGGWDSEAYARQTPAFVRGIHDGVIQWGYGGTNGRDVARDIRVSDVRWLLPYLHRITDAQIRRGLEYSGATRAEADLWQRAIRDRIRQLDRVAAVPDAYEAGNRRAGNQH
jgi:hypothetical protein